MLLEILVAEKLFHKKSQISQYMANLVILSISQEKQEIQKQLQKYKVVYSRLINL